MLKKKGIESAKFGGPAELTNFVNFMPGIVHEGVKIARMVDGLEPLSQIGSEARSPGIMGDRTTGDASLDGQPPHDELSLKLSGLIVLPGIP
jgi:hypothetical protein